MVSLPSSLPVAEDHEDFEGDVGAGLGEAGVGNMRTVCCQGLMR